MNWLLPLAAPMLLTAHNSSLRDVRGPLDAAEVAKGAAWNSTAGKALWSLAARARQLPNSSDGVDALIELSEQVLETSVSSVAAGAFLKAKDDTPGKRLKEEKTLAALADHSGQLERLFHQLADEMEDGGDEESAEARAMRTDGGSKEAGAALAVAAGQAVVNEMNSEADEARALPLFDHKGEAHQAVAATIGDVDHKVVGVSFAERRAAPRSPVFPWPTGLLVAVALAGAGLCYAQPPACGAKTEDEVAASPRLKSAEPREDREGKTSYVVRIARVRVEGVPAQTLAWQLQVGDQKPRPSRFAKTWVWDAPVDRMDVDVDNPTEKITLGVIEQSATLGPPAVLGTVEIAAGVLLAEARKHSEKVKALGDTYVHEKRLALPCGGYFVLEYSLIAFFHWYVGGEHPVRQ